jgi:hypothetical protein
MDISEASALLTSVVNSALVKVTCGCRSDPKCGNEQEWRHWKHARGKSISHEVCRRWSVWFAVGLAIRDGFLSCFLNPRHNATLTNSGGSLVMLEALSDLLAEQDVNYLSCETLHLEILSLALTDEGLRSHPPASLLQTIGTSSMSSTIYPAVLECFSINSNLDKTFELLDGSFVFTDRYYSKLESKLAGVRRKAFRSIPAHENDIFPSNYGEHSRLQLSLHERFKSLELRTTISFEGQIWHLDLSSVLIGYLALERTKPCCHSPTDHLDREKLSNVIATSVAAPYVSDVTVDNWPRGRQAETAIAMTRSNPVAQLLCCERGRSGLLQWECCLNCAVEQVVGGCSIVICG